MEPLTTCVTLTASNVSISVSALLDSGQQETSFPEPSAASSIYKPLPPSYAAIYQVQSITGKPLSRRHVRHRVGPITLRIGLFHTEDIHLLVLEGSTADIILGRPWLVQSHKIQAQSHPVMENRGSPEAGQGLLSRLLPRDTITSQDCHESHTGKFHHHRKSHWETASGYPSLLCPLQWRLLPQTSFPSTTTSAMGLRHRSHSGWASALWENISTFASRTEGHGGIHQGEDVGSWLHPSIKFPCCIKLSMWPKRTEAYGPV